MSVSASSSDKQQHTATHADGELTPSVSSTRESQSSYYLAVETEPHGLGIWEECQHHPMRDLLCFDENLSNEEGRKSVLMVEI